MRPIHICLFFLFTLLSCEKDSHPVSISSVTVVNAVTGSEEIIANFFHTTPVSVYFTNTPRISYGSSYQFSIPSGNSSFVAYTTGDTTQPIFEKNDSKGGIMELAPEGIYSIFLCGQVMPDFQPDALVIKETIPYYQRSDSSMGIRFLNLLPGSSPVKIVLSTGDPVDEASSLSYKSVTNFIKYSTGFSAPQNYTFEFRDVATDAMVATYTFDGVNFGSGENMDNNLYRFRNFTLVLMGVPDGGQNVYLVNNY